MKKTIKIYSPAKLNLFLKIINKRKDGFHNIRSGVTLVNLYDIITIEKSDKTNISYEGEYKPTNGFYSDCIIKKTLLYLKLDSTINLKINIEKNIPVQGGLGSASTNAAGLIIGLSKMKLIEIKNFSDYSSLSSDITLFLYGKNCFVRGLGNLISNYDFPKYYFLLVKPERNLSTKIMYEKFSENKNFYSNLENNNIINEEDNGNDFEKILNKDYPDIRAILDYLDNLDGSIFSRMSGSGSCCYAVFENHKNAIIAYHKFKSFYPNLWSKVVENNF